VIARRNRVTVKVDGRTTSDCPDHRQLFSRGHIVLFPVNGRIEFRKLEIKELPTPKCEPTADRAGFPDS
jgi:hypothetical protein